MNTCVDADVSYGKALADSQMRNKNSYNGFDFTNVWIINTGSNYEYPTFKPAVCEHKKTEIKNAKAATCLEEGYSGDTYCKLCGEKLSDGEIIPATGHNYVWRIIRLATPQESGLKEQLCGYCDEKTGEIQVIAYTGHLTGDINNDGKVNNKDLTRLFQYLSDWYVEIY